MTDTNDDPYADLKQHRATPEMLTGFVPKKIRRQRQHFVKVPWRWVERLAKARHIATYRVALHVLYRHWKGGGLPFALSNTAVAGEGVRPRRKWEALQELEHLGLVTVERRRRRSPRITVIP
jgi:LmbE family N-acetylglucosaminyl deacetylase